MRSPRLIFAALVAAAALAAAATLAACSNAAMTNYGNTGGGPPYTVTYANTTPGTTGSVPVDSTQYMAGSTVTVKGNTGMLSWPPFTFTGWDTRDNGGIDGGGGGTFYAPGTTFTINSNITLYGTWQ